MFFSIATRHSIQFDFFEKIQSFVHFNSINFVHFIYFDFRQFFDFDDVAESSDIHFEIVEKSIDRRCRDFRERFERAENRENSKNHVFLHSSISTVENGSTMKTHAHFNETTNFEKTTNANRQRKRHQIEKNDQQSFFETIVFSSIVNRRISQTTIDQHHRTNANRKILNAIRHRR